MVKKEPAKLLINGETIAASGSTTGTIGAPFLKKVAEIAITCKATFNAAATDGITVKILSSPDDTNFDTDNLASFEPTFAAGGTAQKTILLDAIPQNLRVNVTNDDTAKTVTAVSVWITRVQRY